MYPATSLFHVFIYCLAADESVFKKILTPDLKNLAPKLGKRYREGYQ